MMEQNWIKITPQVLDDLERGNIGNDLWVVVEGETRPIHAHYEWQQGRNPHSFWSRGDGWWDEKVLGTVTHIMSYYCPKMPDQSTQV